MLHRVRPAQTEPATKSAKVEVMLYVEPDKFTAAQKRAAALATDKAIAAKQAKVIKG